MPTRRHALSLLAAAPFAGCAPSTDPAAPWRTADAAQADPRRYALAHAILAPNPHNTQPWLVAFEGANVAVLYCDLKRRLPFTDPNDRQVTLGFGAFIYLYWASIQKLGKSCSVDLFPEGAPTLDDGRLDVRAVARLTILEGEHDLSTMADSGFEAITARRTNRNPYDGRAPAAELLARVAADTNRTFAQLNAPVGVNNGAARVTIETSPDRVARLRDLVWRAFDREMHTQGALAETFGWLRFGDAAVARHRDGLAVEGALIAPLNAVGAFSRAQMLDPNSFANKTSRDDWRRKAMTAPAFISMTTADDTPTTRLLAGMAYARLNLAATAQGLAIHPWSQALEEYAEMTDLYGELRTVLGVSGAQTVQMLVRVGYASSVTPSARRDLGAFIRS